MSELSQRTLFGELIVGVFTAILGYIIIYRLRLVDVFINTATDTSYLSARLMEMDTAFQRFYIEFPLVLVIILVSLKISWTRFDFGLYEIINGILWSMLILLTSLLTLAPVAYALSIFLPVVGANISFTNVFHSLVIYGIMFSIVVYIFDPIWFLDDTVLLLENGTKTGINLLKGGILLNLLALGVFAGAQYLGVSIRYVSSLRLLLVLFALLYVVPGVLYYSRHGHF